MKPRASLCQSNRHRLLTLLFVLLSGIIGAHMVTGSTATHPLGNLDRVSSLSGGTPVTRNYYLHSECSKKYLRMKLRHKKRAVDAKGRQNKRSEVQFQSIGHTGQVRIFGVRSRRYLCFSKKGRLITKLNHKNSERCVFKELPSDDGTELQSLAYPLWYVGFKKNGKPLKGYQRSRNRFKKCFAFIKIPKTDRKHSGPFSNVNEQTLWQTYHPRRTNR